MKSPRLTWVLFLPTLVWAQDLLIDHVRVFDGTRTIEDTSVLVRAGKIIRVGHDAHARADTRVVDGAGRTLLPGLIDAHTHIRSRMELQKSLLFGVTTDLSLNMPPQLAKELKGGKDGVAPSDQADLFSAGFAATAPHGHGTEYGYAVPTLTGPAEAQAWVDARIAEGSDFIKIMYEFGGENGKIGRPSIDQPTLVAIVAAAHKRGKLAIVHIHTDKQAFDASQSGADGLAHLYLFGDDTVDPRWMQILVDHNMFVIPTLTVLRSVCGLSPGRSIIDDAKLDKYLLPEDITNLQKDISKASAADCERPMRAVAQLSAHGIPILAGTDQSNLGTASGASLHGELELLVEAGLTPAQSLRAATSATAQAFRLADRGRIGPGLRADLLLVEGDPTADIKATRNIVAVWKAGVEFDRDAWLAGTIARVKQ
jgi:imidazolonepropionase-like amidohydrolase